MIKFKTKIKEDGSVLLGIQKADGTRIVYEDSKSNPLKESLKDISQKLHEEDELEDFFNEFDGEGGSESLEKVYGDEGELNKYGYTDSFEFDSQLIFISNKTSIPAAVGSRCFPVKLELTRDEILQLIREKIESLAGDALTVEEKIEILDFLMKYKTRIAKVDFRLFQTACALYDVSKDVPLGDRLDWQHRVYMLLRAMPKGQKGML